MKENEHTPIPVQVARDIAHTYNKSMVVILGYDPNSRLTHTTTYGDAPEDKEIAAEVGERCAKLICGDGFKERQSYADYRFIEEGKRAKQVERLIEACQALCETVGENGEVNLRTSECSLIEVRAMAAAALATATKDEGLKDDQFKGQN